MRRGPGIEQSAAEGESVEHLGAVSQLFEIDGAEGNCCLAQRGGDGLESFARAPEDGDADISLRCTRLLDAIGWLRINATISSVWAVSAASLVVGCACFRLCASESAEYCRAGLRA